MNDLYLIGNGFDLAHGLKTSYNDFLLWYLIDSLKTCNAKGSFNDKLIAVTRGSYYWSNIDEYPSISEMLRDMKKMGFSIEYKHIFIKKIIENYRDFKWVDVEYEYFEMLKFHLKYIKNDEYSNWNSSLDEVEKLNNCFELIKSKLVEYLLSIKVESNLVNPQIGEILFEETGISQSIEDDWLEETYDRTNEIFPEEKLFVCFNYTRTMEIYLKYGIYEKKLINIHGVLDEISNPIIFGYGDEINPQYEQIENLNSNEFLKNIKSFNYFKTNNYRKVIHFIEQGNYTVKILGHSCGLSDRILLNTIFEHPNCVAIKIYYYQKSATENDYFEKTQEISRHFKALGKGAMRTKIVPFSQSVPLLPFVTKN